MPLSPNLKTKGPRLKVVIRDGITGLYLSQDGWTVDINTAQDFERGADAIGFAMRNALKSVEVIHAFPEGELDFSTGVLDFSSKQPARIII